MKKAIEIILALTVVGTVLAFGGVQTITISIMEIVIFGLLLAVLLQQVRDGSMEIPIPVWPVLFLVVVAFQLVPLPVGFLGKLSPQRLGDVAMFPGTSWAAISVYSRETWLELVKLLAYVAAFFLAARVSDLRNGRSTLVRLLILLSFPSLFGCKIPGTPLVIRPPALTFMLACGADPPPPS